MDNKKVSGNGIGLGTVLFLIFLTLKLAEVGQVATWSWWWITSPLWIPLALVLGIAAIALILAGIIKLFKN
jgi:membrane protein YdbS with pleckstrin-like domain